MATSPDWTCEHGKARNPGKCRPAIRKRRPPVSVRLPRGVGTAFGDKLSVGTDCGCPDWRHGCAGTSPGFALQFPQGAVGCTMQRGYVQAVNGGGEYESSLWA